MYVIIAFRNLMRNRLFSLINIAGLALAMSVGLVFILNIKRQFDFDQYHPFPERTYRVITDKIYAQGTDHFATSPTLLAQELQAYSFVETVTRLYHSGYAAATGNGKELPLSFMHADPSFLEVFKFELQQNQPMALGEPNAIILSEQKAKAFWGDQNAIGKILTLPGKGDFKVADVIKANKKATHFHFDALLSSVSLRDSSFKSTVSDWADLDGYTYVLLKSKADQDELNRALERVATGASKQLRSKRGEKSQGYQFIAQNLLHINPSSNAMMIDEMNRGLDWGGIAIVSGLVLLLTLMVAFNYTGLSLARSLSRAREVGIRKINGAKRHQIFMQFLTESVVLTLISMVLSCLILPFLDHIPLLAEIIKKLDADASSVVWVLGFALIVSLAAGGLPAWLLSSFDPMVVLQKLNNYRLPGGIGIRKVLITIQFTIAIIFISFLVISKKQIEFERDFNYGFSGENLIYLYAENNDIETLKDQFLQLASVKEVAATSALPLMQSSSGSCFISADNKGSDSLNVEYYAADHGFIPAMGIQLVAGTNFPTHLSANGESVVILNEKAIQQLNFKNASEAVGQFVSLDSSHVQIIGVYKDFINWNLKFGSMPFALRYRPGRFNQLIVKIAPQNQAGSVAALKSVWDKVKPLKPFKYEFYETFIKAKYDDKMRQFLLFDFLTALILSISCLGLVGMVAYAIELRVKEIGIRRTLGASGGQLIWIVSRDFMKILLWASALGLPVAYYIGYNMLNEYAHRIELSAGLFISCFLIMFVIGVVTILSQTYRVSYVNPVDSLRSE
jgi:putative ABC transport system permease protein